MNAGRQSVIHVKSVCVHVHSQDLRTQLKTALASTGILTMDVHPWPLPDGLGVLLKAAAASQVRVQELYLKRAGRRLYVLL